MSTDKAEIKKLQSKISNIKSKIKSESKSKAKSKTKSNLVENPYMRFSELVKSQIMESDLIKTKGGYVMVLSALYDQLVKSKKKSNDEVVAKYAKNKEQLRRDVKRIMKSMK